MELSWIHVITESSEKSTEMSLVLDYSHPKTVPSLVHGVNKTRKHWHCCVFQIVFSIPIYPLQKGFYPLKICLIPLNLKRVVYCFTMGVQKKKENRADLPPVSKCSGNPDINSSAFTEFPSKPESRKKKKKKHKKTSLYTVPQDPTTI